VDDFCRGSDQGDDITVTVTRFTAAQRPTTHD